MCTMIPIWKATSGSWRRPGNPLLPELEDEARRESIPIVGPVVGELLFVLARATGAARRPGAGHRHGVFGHLPRPGLCGPPGPGGFPGIGRRHGHRARGNFDRAGLNEVVEVRVGEALKLMAEFSETFDLIFLDIDKESYLPALSHCRRLLRAGGLLVADNVGFSGAADFNRELVKPRLARRPPPELFAPPLSGARRPGPGGEGGQAGAALVGKTVFGFWFLVKKIYMACRARQ